MRRTLYNSPAGLRIFVTHDAVLLPMASRLLPSQNAPYDWPKFLETASLWNDDNIVAFAYHNYANLLQTGLNP